MNGNTLRLSWRIGLHMSRPDDAFESLRELLLKHRNVVDEVAFFETISHHLYLPLEFFRENADVFRRRIATLKSDGIPSVGINVLTTIGHVNEGWDVFDPLPFQAMIGHDGAVSKSCACPNTPEMRDYVAAKYALFAGINPDFIWVDDDIRMQNHGVGYGCFCPTCLDIFSKTTGKSFDRESLVKELDSPEGGASRQAWVEQNARSIESLLAHVERAIHDVNPDIRTGLMTAGVEWTTYSGQAFDRWFPALKACKARPGGGFYSDERPIDMFHKALSTARQCVLLPDDVSDRQYELENFPYSSLDKAVTTVVNECTLALAAGCNGVAFNALGMWEPNDRTFNEKEPLMRRVAQARPFWEAFVAHAADHPLSGLWPAWHSRLLAGRAIEEGEGWLDWSPFHEIAMPNLLGRLGLPVCAERPGNGVVLSGHVAEVFGDEELRQMLAGPVLMDAFALEILTQRGLEDLCGVRLAGWLDNGVAERLTDDPLNGSLAGQLRDIRAEFWNDAFMKSARLEPRGEGVRVLSVLETYLGERRGPCVTAFENALGGRVVVMGHSPWRFLGAKREQIMNVADWAMRGRLPVRIPENVPVIPMVRLSPDRAHGVVVLLHTGLDPIECMTVAVRAPETPVCLSGPGRRPVPLEACGEQHCWSVKLRDVEPWQVLALFLG
ncbi:hypothetical protein ACFLSJ_00065 [Verrucomicrobiota bacterium]